MTGKEFKELRKSLNLSRKKVASDMCLSVFAVDAWQQSNELPAWVEKFFCVLYGVEFKGGRKAHETLAFRMTMDLFPEDE